MDIAPEATCMGSTRSQSYSNYKSILTTPVCATQDFVVGKKESKEKTETTNHGRRPPPSSRSLLLVSSIVEYLLYLQTLYI
jgi:hypothetical protein